MNALSSSGMQDYVLIVNGVTKIFNKTKALDNISIVLRRKSITSLLGPKGAGKTTLIRIIIGVLKQTKGIVEYLDENLVMGYFPQEDGLFDRLNGWDNLLLYASLYGINKKLVRDIIREYATRLGLLDYLKLPIAKYNKVLRKKLSLLIALLPNPNLLLLDEPTAGLDPVSRRDIWNIILEERKKGVSILLSTSYANEAEELSDYVYIIDNGKLVAEGSLEELKTKHASFSVIEIGFIGGSTSIQTRLTSLGYFYIVEEGLIKVYSKNPEDDILEIMGVLQKERQGLSIKSLNVSKPTLDDVFLKLTGKRLVNREI